MEREINPSLIKEFSKEHSAEARQKTAEDVKEKRAEHFKNKKTIGQRLERAAKELEKKHIDVKTAQEEIKNLRDELVKYEQSIIYGLLKLIGSEREAVINLKKIVEQKSARLTEMQKQLQDLQNLINDLEQQKEDKSKLREAQAIIVNFYKQQEESLSVYEKGQEAFRQEQAEARQVENIIEGYDKMLLHGIHPFFIPRGVNSLLLDGVDWQTKIKIALAIRPQLATFTSESGDGWQNRWSEMGLVVNGGEVLHAEPGDAGSVAQSPSKRRSGSKKQENIKEAIDGAILNRHHSTYNELDVFEPDFYGFYYCTDTEYGSAGRRQVQLSEVVLLCKEIGIPLYELSGGQLYESTVAPDNESLIRGEIVKPGDTVKNKFVLSRDKEAELKKEILENQVFALTPVDAICIDSAAKGREAYIERNATRFTKKNREGLSKTSRKDKNDKQQGAVITSFHGFNSVITFREPEQAGYPMTKTVEEIGFKKKKGMPREYSVSDGGHYAKIGLGWTIDVGSPHVGEKNQGYLDGMVRAIEEEKKRYEEEKQQAKNEDEIKVLNYRLMVQIKNIAANVVGFGIQAAEVGDAETQRRAFEITKEILPIEDFEKILKERVGPAGEFIWREEDILTEGEKIADIFIK